MEKVSLRYPSYQYDFKFSNLVKQNDDYKAENENIKIVYIKIAENKQ